MSPSRNESRVVLRRRNRPASVSYGTLREDSEDDESEYTEDLVSVTGTDQTGGELSVGRSSKSSFLGWDLDLPQERNRVLDDLANKHLQPEETLLMIKKFEKSADVPFRRAYQMGTAVRGSLSSTHAPQVALVFVPGADLPEVVRREQNSMVSHEPDQRDAIWRVNTAGHLLSEVSVTRDLSLVSRDVTKDVANNTHRRLARALQQGRNLHQYFRTDAVTIDSDNVEVVHDFAAARNAVDLSATLIEVNVSSLTRLMLDYRYIINTSGDQLTFQQTKDLLDRMIEAARRFCLRSPILFRMSTRILIINSNNTRYGHDSEQGFQTFTTSRGIQEIINMSASYFNSLDPSAPGMDDLTQQHIRPKFLQMLTLLLSLLNDNDLAEMSEFLEGTYGIKPERSDLELLFLKVIPLTSINSKVFLQGLIPAVDRWPVTDRAANDYEGVWAEFLRRLAERGYLLPGSVENLGHRESSWISKWPRTGINSSTVFSRLQYHGEHSTSFNEIPAARFRYEAELKELTVIMTNNETYTIHPEDYEPISALTKGTYSMTKCDDGSIDDLEISEYILNRPINEAIRIVNDAIRKYNYKYSPSSNHKRVSWLRRPKNEEQFVFRDLESAARLTRNEAIVNDTKLAVAYKLNGRNVPKSEAIRHMTFSYTKVCTLFRRLCEAAGRSLAVYEEHIGRINKLLAADRNAHQIEKDLFVISDAPIAQGLGPNQADIPSPRIWYDYFVDLIPDPHYPQGLLHIAAKVDFVASVQWRRAGQQAEIALAALPTIFSVSPLKPVSEAQQEDEIRVGDLVLLVGRYMVVGSPQGNDYTRPLVMTNWLEIQDAIGQEGNRRGRNFQVKNPLPVTRFI